ncbi:MAG TPA: sodium:solute symporter family protein [Pirellulales bacterium]|jgi:SSS family solute:Na+ symporter|nr:sodium:solute symporter family protein [Pirellulales bacterium]
MNLTYIDWAIMLVYFVFVLGIGFMLRRTTRSSTDFFLSGRSLPAWVTGLAFISANLGALEVIGMGASGAQYGIATSHFYWIGAIPAMVFVGIFMMPFYYGSRARSVPEYLKLRFDEKTRAWNAATFAVMTVFASGMSMFVMAKLIVTLKIFDGLFAWLNLPPKYIFDTSIVVTALIVLVYIFMAGLTSAIYNEVLQFFLIVAGFLPLVVLGLINVGGWEGLKQKVPDFVHSWSGPSVETMAGFRPPGGTPTGPQDMWMVWIGLAMGLGFVLSFGYWCTDFLVIQRAMAADSMSAARRTPLIAAIPKMFFPALVIVPGIIAVVVPMRGDMQGISPEAAAANAQMAAQDQVLPKGLIPVILNEETKKPELDYNMAIPNMLLQYFPTGLLGLGLTALLASFMSGMAGNVTAFNTVWTYDIYQAYIHPGASDRHYLWMGRFTTIWGIALSVATAYVAARFNNIMNMLQLVFGFVNAPLFATFLLGMFWKRTTGHGAFFGLLAGTAAAAIHVALTLPAGAAVGLQGGWISVTHTYPSEMARNFWGAIYAFAACFIVTIVLSLLTKPREDRELVGLVYSLTERPKDDARTWYQRPAALGIVVLALVVVLNVIFR